ncbi:MAG: RDD family protein, partial [Acidimicrobiia bacterium]
MRLDDRITISTPEGLDMEITLAGVGSRAIAGLLDLTIEVLVLIALLLAFRAIGSGGNGFVVATFVVVAFL